MPSRVMLIRHAEKPADDNDPHLSAAGRQRSYALVDMFGPGGRLAGAQFLFAADKSKHSNRSVETLQPLALATHQDINHDYEDDEYKALAKRLKDGKKYRDATVLICWHHGTIPALARALGVRSEYLPWKTWPDDVFDQVWVLDFAWGSATIRAEAQ